jgi:Holliday junction resolvasome RuvABC endonuclease subunit
LRAKLELIESENERLRGELERRPPVLTAQLSLLPTDSQLIATDEMAVENEFVTSPDDSDLKSDTQAQGVLALETAQAANKLKEGKFATEDPAIAVKGVTNSELSKMIGVSARTILDWSKTLKKGETIGPSKHKDKIAQWELGEDNLWYKKSE